MLKEKRIEPETMNDQDLLKILNEGHIEQQIDYSINNRINKAKEEKPMKPLFSSFLFTGEINFLAGDTGAGKTLLAFQLADSISNGLSTLEQNNETEPLIVLYYDFELSNQSLLKRYADYNFSENFLCPDINDILIANEGKFTIDIIRNGIESTGANIIVIDNISAIALKSTQDQDTALQLMKEIKMLNIEKGITFIILAHTPKIPSNIPLSINHIAGSKHLTNFADSVSIIGKSSQKIERRYLKQLKSRNDELIERVLVMDIVFEKYLHFIYVNYDDEKNHLDYDPNKEQNKKNKLIEIAKSYFGNNSYYFNDFCNEYHSRTDLSIDRAKQIHRKLKMNNLIIKDPNSKKWILNRNEV